MNILLLPAPTTTPTDRKESEKQHILQDTFELYICWRSLPALFKNPPMDKKSGVRLSVEDFLETMGVDDEQVIDLSKIKNKTAFCERFDVHKDTITKWEKEIKERDPMSDLRTWAMGLSKNVLTALYNNAIRKGMAFEVKLWFQLINQWNEKTVVEHDYKGVKSIIYEIVEPKHETIGNQEADQSKAGPSA